MNRSFSFSADVPFDLTLSLSKGEVVARRLPISSTLRQAQGEDIGARSAARRAKR
jgi:hypothetical protein